MGLTELQCKKLTLCHPLTELLSLWNALAALLALFVREKVKYEERQGKSKSILDKSWWHSLDARHLGVTPKWRERHNLPVARSHYHGEVLGGLRHFSQTKNFLIDVSPLYTLEGTSQLFSLDIPGAQVTPLHSYQGPEYPVDRIQMKNPCTSFLTTCCKSIDFGMGEHCTYV